VGSSCEHGKKILVPKNGEKLLSGITARGLSSTRSSDLHRVS
jgi:hypothetical protein